MLPRVREKKNPIYKSAMAPSKLKPWFVLVVQVPHGGVRGQVAPAAADGRVAVVAAAAAGRVAADEDGDVGGRGRLDERARTRGYVRLGTRPVRGQVLEVTRSDHY